MIDGPSQRPSRSLALSRISAALLSTALLLTPYLAQARTHKVQSRLKAMDIPMMAKLCSRGEVALVEAHEDGSARQVVLFQVFNAPPEMVWDTVMNVERYPEMLKTIISTKIIRRGKNQFAFTWEMDLPFFNLSGTRMQRGKRPRLVEVRGVSGHLKGTSERWELFPLEGGKKTLAAFYRALDVETGGLLLKTMVDLEPSMELGANLSTSFVHLRRLKRFIEKGRAYAAQRRTGPVPSFRSLRLGSGEMDLSKLSALLRYGQLALIESYPDGALKQVALFAEVNAPTSKMQKIVQHPELYPEFIHTFAQNKVTPMKDGRLKLNWELEVPMVNLEGVSMMTIEKNGSVDAIAVEGDITRGRWRWEFTPLGERKTIPIHYTYSDVREASWVTRKIVDKQPLFEHGIVIASGTVAMHAMKARAEGVR